MYAAKAKHKAARGSVSTSPDRQWQLLGFDVTDSSTSGLCNGGFDPSRENVDALRARWAPRLNAHGLFADARDEGSVRRPNTSAFRRHCHGVHTGVV